jgi:hypothetical protein
MPFVLCLCFLLVCMSFVLPCLCAFVFVSVYVWVVVLVPLSLCLCLRLVLVSLSLRLCLCLVLSPVFVSSCRCLCASLVWSCLVFALRCVVLRCLVSSCVVLLLYLLIEKALPLPFPAFPLPCHTFGCFDSSFQEILWSNPSLALIVLPWSGLVFVFVSVCLGPFDWTFQPGHFSTESIDDDGKGETLWRLWPCDVVVVQLRKWRLVRTVQQGQRTWWLDCTEDKRSPIIGWPARCYPNPKPKPSP